MRTYTEVDYDVDRWLELPPSWGEGSWPDHRTWAREMAEAYWDFPGLTPGEHEVDNLALVLAMYAERWPGEADGGWEVDHYLHLPDPRLDPLHVEVWVGDDPALTLRDYIFAEDPEAIEKPLVEEFTTQHLGTGLRALRYRPFDPGPGRPPEPGALYAVLRYAWRVDATYVVVLCVNSHDLTRLVQAAEDIEEFARRIRIVRYAD